MGLITLTANCGIADDWFARVGRRIAWTETPQRGDVVFFDFSGGHAKRSHVGLVEHVNANGSLTTIEGNTSVTSQDNGGAVMRRTRWRYQVTSYGRPAYASDAEREAYMQLAAEQIGTKEVPSGSNKVKYNTWYYGRAVSGSAYPWCQVFVCWVLLSGTKASGKTTTEGGNGKVTVTLDTLQQGSQGAQVKTLQRILYARLGGIAVDGVFGPITRAKVIRVQRQLGLCDDGIVGANTWTALLTQMN